MDSALGSQARSISAVRWPDALAAAAGIALTAELWRGGMPWTPAFGLCLALLAALRRRAPGKLFEAFPDRALFLVLMTAYLSTFRWHGGDDAPNSLLPFCLLRHGTLTLDPMIDPWFLGKTENFTAFHQGRHLSIFPVAPALLALPVYLVSALSGAPISESFLHNLSKISGALMTALSAVALRRALIDRCSRQWALTLCLIYGLGTWSFSVSSQALWQHGPAQLGAALGLWGLSLKTLRGSWLAGFGLALATAARPDSVFFLAASGAFLLLCQPRRLPGFLGGAALPLGLLATYWWLYTGLLMPPESAFQSRLFRDFQPAALAGLLVSPTRGLFFFFPTALFAAAAIWRRRADPLVAWLGAACLGPLFLLCFYDPWVGGGTFGPRYFAVSALVLLWACADLEPASRRRSAWSACWWTAAAASIFIHSLGAYLTWPGSMHSPEAKAALWRWSLHPALNALTDKGALGTLPAEARLATLAAMAAAIVQCMNAFLNMLYNHDTSAHARPSQDLPKA